VFPVCRVTQRQASSTAGASARQQGSVPECHRIRSRCTLALLPLTWVHWLVICYPRRLVEAVKIRSPMLFLMWCLPVGWELDAARAWKPIGWSVVLQGCGGVGRSERLSLSAEGLSFHAPWLWEPLTRPSYWSMSGQRRVVNERRADASQVGPPSSLHAFDRFALDWKLMMRLWRRSCEGIPGYDAESRPTGRAHFHRTTITNRTQQVPHSVLHCDVVARVQRSSTLMNSARCHALQNQKSWSQHLSRPAWHVAHISPPSPLFVLRRRITLHYSRRKFTSSDWKAKMQRITARFD